VLYPSISNTILVLDEDFDSVDFIRQVLARDEFAVECAEDWQSALQLIRVIPPVLILIDYHFAGLHLDDFLMRVQRRRPSLPIVLMGTFSASEPGIYHLPKPFGSDILLEQVRALLGTPIPLPTESIQFELRYRH